MIRKGQRLDLLLLSRGLCQSREQAKRCIMAGLVYVDGQKEDKAGALFPENAAIVLREAGQKYVSRGGWKLEKALEVFPLDPKGKICIDIGASTGGFTDCLLQHGAARVFAIDVGRGQLHWKLRNDPRVVSMERTNIRYVEISDIGMQLPLATVDVAFISLKLVLPVLMKLLQPGGQALCLVKPQFEAGREQVGKKGVVRDPAIHAKVLSGTIDAAETLGFRLAGLDFSPIKGPEGNIEYLALFEKARDPAECAGGNGIPDGKAFPEEGGSESRGRTEVLLSDIQNLVRRSHEVLDVR